MKRPPPPGFAKRDAAPAPRFGLEHLELFLYLLKSKGGQGFSSRNAFSPFYFEFPGFLFYAIHVFIANCIQYRLGWEIFAPADLPRELDAENEKRGNRWKLSARSTGVQIRLLQ